MPLRNSAASHASNWTVLKTIPVFARARHSGGSSWAPPHMLTSLVAIGAQDVTEVVAVLTVVAGTDVTLGV